MLIFYNW